MGKSKQSKRQSGDESGGLVFSTNRDLDLTPESEHEASVSPQNQLLYVSLDRKQRAGKPVTIVEGFTGSGMDLLLLGKALKQRCGVGGSVKDGLIRVHGEHRAAVVVHFVETGYQVKRKGG